MTTVPARAAVGVEELRRAWRAVQDGQFRGSTARAGSAGPASAASRVRRDSSHWVASGPVLAVVGCAGSVGASTVALAVATAAGAARVLECCTVTASGLAGASTAELGRDVSGWCQGNRGQVLLERTGEVLLGVDEVPRPSPVGRRLDLSVIDVGWELGAALATPSWIADLLRSGGPVIAVTSATIPGLRRLEGALALLAHTPVVAAVVGPRRRRWPKGVEHTAGPLTRHLIRREDLVEVPHDAGLAVRGLDPTPLPAAVLGAGQHLHRRTQPEPRKGTPS